MAKVDQNKKRGPGRPVTGRDPAVSARVPKEVLARVDEWAAAYNYTRSEAIARLLENALEGVPWLRFRAGIDLR